MFLHAQQPPAWNEASRSSAQEVVIDRAPPPSPRQVEVTLGHDSALVGQTPQQLHVPARRTPSSVPSPTLVHPNVSSKGKPQEPTAASSCDVRSQLSNKKSFLQVPKTASPCCVRSQFSNQPSSQGPVNASPSCVRSQLPNQKSPRSISPQSINLSELDYSAVRESEASSTKNPFIAGTSPSISPFLDSQSVMTKYHSKYHSGVPVVDDAEPQLEQLSDPNQDTSECTEVATPLDQYRHPRRSLVSVGHDASLLLKEEELCKASLMNGKERQRSRSAELPPKSPAIKFMAKTTSDRNRLPKAGAGSLVEGDRRREDRVVHFLPIKRRSRISVHDEGGPPKCGPILQRAFSSSPQGMLMRHKDGENVVMHTNVEYLVSEEDTYSIPEGFSGEKEEQSYSRSVTSRSSSEGRGACGHHSSPSRPTHVTNKLRNNQRKIHEIKKGKGYQGDLKEPPHGSAFVPLSPREPSSSPPSYPEPSNGEGFIFFGRQSDGKGHYYSASPVHSSTLGGYKQDVEPSPISSSLPSPSPIGRINSATLVRPPAAGMKVEDVFPGGLLMEQNQKKEKEDELIQELVDLLIAEKKALGEEKGKRKIREVSVLHGITSSKCNVYTASKVML